MQVAVERRPGSQVALTVTVEPSVVQERMEQLFQKYARRVTVPGFRPGKAPRKLIEGRIDQSALLQDAVEQVIDATYKEALREQELEPLERGEIKDLHTGDDMTLTYQVIVSVRPTVALPAYETLVVRHTATQVTDEQVDTEVERLREQGVDFAPVMDSGIEQDDFVTVDYTMTIDGEPYPDGDATGYPLEIGSDTLFPELNEGLLGVKAGETKTLSTTYPDDFANTVLAGKTAEFTVTVQEVRRRIKPDVNDAWVMMISNGALQTVDAMRERIREELEQMARRMDNDYVREELMRQLLDQTEMEVPETLAEEEYEHLMETLEHRLAHEHMTLEEYAERTNRRVAAIEDEQQMLARDLVRRSLVLQEIARKEGIAITEEDIDGLVAIESFSRGERSMDRVRKNMKKLRKEMEESGQLDRLMNRLFHEKVMAFLESHADVQIEGLPAAEAEREDAPAGEAESVPESPAAEE